MSSEYYGMPWILTVFAFSLEGEMSWRIVEGVLVKGWSVVYCFVLAILDIFISKCKSYV